jgi:hypothetical protein
MNKALFGITLLLVVGLFLAGCSNTPEIPAGSTDAAGNAISATPDAYVDEQIIDENQSVEIGAMI